MTPINQSKLAELIYAIELSATYTDVAKATDEDLRQLASHSLKAAQIFAEMAAKK